MNNKDRSKLLELARTSIEYYLDNKKQYTLDNQINPIFLAISVPRLNNSSVYFSNNS